MHRHFHVHFTTASTQSHVQETKIGVDLSNGDSVLETVIVKDWAGCSVVTYYDFPLSYSSFTS